MSIALGPAAVLPELSLARAERGGRARARDANSEPRERVLLA